MKKLISFLLPYLRSDWKRVLGSILLAVPLAGIKAYQAYLVRPLFDKGLSPHGTFNEALFFASVLLGLGLLNYPIRFFHFYWIRYVVENATCRLRVRVYSKIQRLPLSFFTASKQGNLMAHALNDTQVMAEGFRNLVSLVREPLTAIALLVLAISRDWQLTLVIFCVAPLFLVIFQKSGKYVKKGQEQVQKNVADMTHAVSEGIAGQKVAKAFNLQSYVLSRFEKVQNAFFSSQMYTTIVEENAHPLVEVVGAIAFSGVLLFAHHRIVTGAMTTGDFISFVTSLALLMDPLRKYSQANVKVYQAMAAGDRVLRLLGESVENDDGDIEAHEFKDKVEIKNVNFSYGEVQVLSNFSLTIHKGKRVALVGPSGSGKSTLVNLLLRLYPVNSGEILIDGIPIHRYKLSSLRKMFGLVSQDLFVFNDTVEENLRVGRNLPEAKLWEALDVAGARGFVGELPEGLKTIIGDRGTRLSGGQCQRLTIARAFLQDSPILLFDEATSALDNESEKLVQAALDRLSGEKTVVAVAHRLSTIQNYDTIIVLHRGEKVEEGTHLELMQKQGEYAKLYELSLIGAI